MAQNFDSTLPATGSTTFGTLYGILRDHQDAIRSGFSGTSFPANPLPGQPCFRTDRNTDYGGALYYYSGDPSIGENGWVDEAQASLLYNALEAEVQAARGTAASLDARLDVAINEDGTLKSSAPAGSWWMTEADAVAYVSATQFTVDGDKTAIYLTGRALHLIQTSDDYGYVDSAAYDGVTLKTTVTVIGATVDAGLTGVEYGQSPVNMPFGAQETSEDGKIPVAGSTGLDKSWIEEHFKELRTTNLIKNGNFSEWSSGTSSAPDNWVVRNCSAAKGNDGTIGSDYVTITTDGLGTTAKLGQYESINDAIKTWCDICIALHLKMKIAARVRSTSTRPTINLENYKVGDSHSGSGNWETLWAEYQFTGTESLGTGFAIKDYDNSSSITFDVAECRLYIGDLELPYQENPLDISVLNKSALTSQHSTNLIKNGLFASWSAGTSSAPDNWFVVNATVAKGNDGSIGSDYATVTTDGLGSAAYFAQTDSVSSQLSDWLTIVKTLNLTITVGVRVRTTNSSVVVRINDGVGGVAGDTHSGSGNWETLWVIKKFDGTETALGMSVYLPAADNTSAITFDVAEARLYIGNIELPYQENQLDRTLEAIHYQDTTPTNYEYRNLRTEVGQCTFTADGVNSIYTQTVTFQQPFTKLLVAGLMIMDNTLTTDLFDDGLAAAGSTSSSFVAHLHCASIPTSGTLTAMWFAIGVD